MKNRLFLRFGFLPARLRGASGNLLALLRRQLLGAGLATLLTATRAQLNRSRVPAVRLALGQFGLTGGHVHDELGELVEVSGPFTFWHGSNMPCLTNGFYPLLKHFFQFRGNFW